ncbi:MAG: diphosphomevalonate decarboxylase [Lentimicrobium sp.]|jgi:diphosphomevalonate decarboxylase|nr:diphosphomevalonate decarboxylase [Lentimicrobium sp.]MDD4597182.1 diphosphomevalonate decarboxylase [Lentimicrobiaceae bacterium]
MNKFSTLPEHGLEACWKSPSNIALIKYWGKSGRQLPRNASLSITLNKAYTLTRVVAKSLASGYEGSRIHFIFNGNPNPEFASRIENFIREITSEIPFLSQAMLMIESSNTFPHSAGIASSASAMSALALCLCDIENQLSREFLNETALFRKASYIARLGSGSACRSVYGNFTVWGHHEAIYGSTDEFAVPLPVKIHPTFLNIKDTILIVDPETKKVSSSAGHRLMEGHPFASARFKQAHENLGRLVVAIEQGDWETFISITENEALSLHAMMMTSNPGYVLMQPETLTIMRKIQTFRNQSGAKVCFTLDAGPNIHLIYADNEQEKLLPLIEALKDLCFNQSLLMDEMGEGPEKLTCN